LGVSLLGGNAYGIFIHSVQKDSIADDVGLRVGDQILEYNGTDLRRATAEYAAFELAKPADKVTAMVQSNILSELRGKMGAREELGRKGR
jgi:discs large protein 5